MQTTYDERVKTFIEENKERIEADFRLGKTTIILGESDLEKTNLANAIWGYLSSTIPTEERYEACVDVESIDTSRVLADKKSRNSAFIANFCTLKSAEKFLSSDYHVAKDILKDGNEFSFIFPFFYQHLFELTPQEVALDFLKKHMDNEQFKEVESKGISYITYMKDSKPYYSK